MIIIGSMANIIAVGVLEKKRNLKINFVEWLKNDYRLKLRMYLRANYDRIYEEVYGYPPEDE